MPMLPGTGSGQQAGGEREPPPRPPGRPFSVSEANRLLPYLRAALGQARSHLEAMRSAYREMRQIEAVGRDAQGDWILAADHRAAVRRLREHHLACDALIAAVAARGCQVKDLDAGICDFEGVIDGRPVLLCWQIDEPTVAHYHGPTDGFAKRRPIPPGTP